MILKNCNINSLGIHFFLKFSIVFNNFQNIRKKIQETLVKGAKIIRTLVKYVY